MVNIRKINPNSIQLKPMSRASGAMSNQSPTGVLPKKGLSKRQASDSAVNKKLNMVMPNDNRSSIGAEYLTGNQSAMSGGSLTGIKKLPILKA